MIRICVSLFLWGAMTLYPASAMAATIFDTFDTGGGFDPTNNSTAAIDSLVNTSSTTVREAAEFTVSGSNATLDSITLPMALLSNVADPYTLRVRLTADNGGAPGTTLEVLSENENIWPLFTNPFATTTTLTSTSHPLLSSGDSYWIVTELTALTAVNLGDVVHYEWFFNTSGITVPTWQQEVIGGGLPTDPWTGFNGPQNLAFQVEGTPVPEPAAASLLAIGMLLVGLARRFRIKPERR